MPRTERIPTYDVCRPHQFLDTISRDGLRTITARFGCPPRLIATVCQIHDGMHACVQNDGEFSEPFQMTNEG